MMKRDLRFFLKLFWSTLTISAVTFGGGYVIVSVMRKKFVQQLQWISEEEMLDMLSIAQSAPGVMAVNTSIIMGYQLAGFAGAMVSMVGTVLPPFVILCVVSLFYEAFRDNAVVRMILQGMQAGVAAVILDAVIGIGQGVLKGEKAVSIVIMLASFLAIAAFGVNIMLVIAVSGIFGLCNVFYKRRKKSL